MMTIKCVPFDALTVRELYGIMALRQMVFVVEQNCPYLDADGKDLEGWHLMLFNSVDEENPEEGGKGVLSAYTRLLPKGVSYNDYASIGRVVSASQARGTGTGKAIMQESIKQMGQLFPNQPIKIGAQSYLLKFYESLGFESTGEAYLEDNIPHTSMILK